ncbi:MAG: 7-carboxy-7-deazaguanine synthase QueE [Bacteroidales bacterium]
MEDLFEGGKKLPLVEDFYTIQGEGYHTGKAAYFIRLGGCDIGCSWCDAKYTWNRHLHPLVMTDEIVSRALSFPSRSIVVTGGEPSSYPLEYLCNELLKNEVATFVETSGSYPLTGKWDWVCLSPKKQSPPLTDIYSQANELKVIIHELSDLDWAEENASRVEDTCSLYLQPEWSRYEKIISAVVDYVKNNPSWNISLQAHKFMHIP